MQVIDCDYDYDKNKYVIQFMDSKGVTWFRELDTYYVYSSPKGFRKWLNSLIEDVELRR